MLFRSRDETAQVVHVGALDLDITFEAGTGIWTENSYKFTRDGVEAMLAAASLDLAQWHVDPANYFALALASPALTSSG